MTPKADLHELIKSLTKSEKRYFALFAKRHIIAGENKYIGLFNCIEKQKEYNEVKVKRLLNNKQTYTNLAAEKAYLKELILKSLKHFHEKNFIDSVLYDRLIQIEILYEKGLYKMGFELIDKSVALAIKHEMFLIHSQLLIWKINYAIKLNTFESIFTDSATASKNAALFLETVNYKKSYHELFLIANKAEEIKNKNQIKKLITKLKPISARAVPQSYLGAHYYYAILSFIAVLENNAKNTIYYFEKNVGIFKSNRLFCKDEPNLYLNSANNYIFALIMGGELKKAETEIDDLQKTTDSLKLTIQQKARTFINIIDNKLLILSKQNKWEAAYNAVKEIEKDFVVYEKFVDLPRKTYLYFSFANIYFFSKYYKITNKFLNRIIASKKDKEADTSLIALAMVIQLITMIESQELLLFKNKLTSTRKYIKQEMVSDWLQQFCDFLSGCEKNKPEKELKNRLIKNSINDTALKKLLGYFDLVKWVEKK